jgi:hypothetical protein
MGRTLPSITQAFLNEQQSLTRFRRALRLEDQRALDDLLGSSRRHLAAAAYASHLLPFEVMLLSMLVEEHKQVLRLQQELDALKARVDAMGESANPIVKTQGDNNLVATTHEDANNVGNNQGVNNSVGAIHELPLRYEDRDEAAAVEAHEFPLRYKGKDEDAAEEAQESPPRNTDKYRDPGGRL